MKLHELRPFAEEKKQRKRRGRGAGTGLGCTAGKGHKGQKARAGGGPSLGFEGGQMPLVRRVPKRGFRSMFPRRYAVVNLEDIERRFPDKTEIGVDDLRAAGSGKSGQIPVKVLARGELSRGVTIEAHQFSKKAREKIEQAGGRAKVLEG
jgi:large subunit ribosomal protein L15